MRFLAFIAAVFLLCPVPVLAAADQLDAGLVREAEDYLQSLDTVKARFVQTNPDGTQKLGTFYLNRPGRMRFDYDAPEKDFVVADGIQLFFYDSELGQVNSAPISQTLADFLLRRDIRFGGDVRPVTTRDGGGLKQIVLTQSADPNAGTLTLGFRDEPYVLKKWRVVDPSGQITEVELFDVQQDVALPNSLFVFTDPRYPRGKYND